MQFPYQSSFVIGTPPPSIPPGSLLRWRPFIPITILDPAEAVQRRYTRALVDTGADETVFPERLLGVLGLSPFPSTGQRIIWRGVEYRTQYALVRLVLDNDRNAQMGDGSRFLGGAAAVPRPGPSRVSRSASSNLPRRSTGPRTLVHAQLESPLTMFACKTA